MRRPAVALLVLGLAGCGSAETAEEGAVTVFAAASLTESFTTIGERFEAARPGTTVTFNFAGSSALAAQITEGAPADVFASASPRTMATVTGVGEPVTFVRNQLVIAVGEGNPGRVTGLADLTRPGLKVALCAEAVPCGAAATTALGAIEVTPVTREQDVKAALSKVKLGEVDAALVYRTDAQASAAEVDAIEFPESARAINDYPIVALTDTPGARAFVDYVRTPEATKILTDAGFQAP